MTAEKCRNNHFPDHSTDIGQYSATALAYLGDAVLELMVREMLIRTGISSSGKLNEMAQSYVRATAQSRGAEKLFPYLTEEEKLIYRRGRNAGGSHPKSATAIEYRRATGFETLFGALFISGQHERARKLFMLYTETEGSVHDIKPEKT